MTDADLYELPMAVRNRFQEIPDEHFADHPQVAEIRAQLDALEVEHRQAAQRSHTLTAKLSELIAQAELARSEALRLNDTRPRRLADSLLSGDQVLEQDQTTLAQINGLHHFSDAVALATPQIERLIAQASANTRQIVSSMEGLQDAYRGLLDKLKLAEAERQAYA